MCQSCDFKEKPSPRGAYGINPCSGGHKFSLFAVNLHMQNFMKKVLCLKIWIDKLCN